MFPKVHHQEAWPILIELGAVEVLKDLAGQVQSRLVLSCLVLSCLVLSCPVLSCLVLSCLVLPCFVLLLPGLALSCLVLFLS